MSPTSVDGRRAMFERACHVLCALRQRQALGCRALFVPGRLEVLGKHTDYAGGRSLLGTVERGFVVVCAPRDDDRVRLVDAGRSETTEFALGADLVATPGHWSNYPMTVARRIARNFPGAKRGADLVFLSDLPVDAGMSSSSAFLVAVFLALADLNDLERNEGWRREIRSTEHLAGYLGTIENGESFGSLEGDRGVGTFGGSEDHTAMLCCEAGQLSQYSFCPVRFERTVRLPAGWTFVIASSGVAAPKTGEARDAYNRASLAARRILAIWREAGGADLATLGAAVAPGPGVVDRIRRALDGAADPTFSAGALADRLEQFVEESTVLVPLAGDALDRADLGAFGSLVDRSQAAAERLLGNQVPETMTLQRLARALGAAASSAFGAGFGGSVWALVRDTEAPEFAGRWAEHYRRRFPEPSERAVFFAGAPGPSAIRL